MALIFSCLHTKMSCKIDVMIITFHKGSLASCLKTFWFHPRQKCRNYTYRKTELPAEFCPEELLYTFAKNASKRVQIETAILSPFLTWTNLKRGIETLIFSINLTIVINVQSWLIKVCKSYHLSVLNVFHNSHWTQKCLKIHVNFKK